jgi:hypothetical protein
MDRSSTQFEITIRARRVVALSRRFAMRGSRPCLQSAMADTGSRAGSSSRSKPRAPRRRVHGSHRSCRGTARSRMSAAGPELASSAHRPLPSGLSVLGSRGHGFLGGDSEWRPCPLSRSRAVLSSSMPARLPARQGVQVAPHRSPARREAFQTHSSTCLPRTRSSYQGPRRREAGRRRSLRFFRSPRMLQTALTHWGAPV